MTREEFQEWLRFAQECFTGIDPWLTRVVKTGENPPTRKGILHKWFLALEDVPLAAAKEATAKMHRGDIEEPRVFDRLPAAIRRHVGIQPKSFERPWERERYDADGRRMYCCLDCLDVGRVSCWHPKSMRAAVDGTLGQPGTLYSAAVVCRCAAGQSRQSKQPLPVYDPERWLALDRIEDGRGVVGDIRSETEQQRLIAWMTARLAQRREAEPAELQTAMPF